VVGGIEGLGTWLQEDEAGTLAPSLPVGRMALEDPHSL
jgi:hypothetical protein